MVSGCYQVSIRLVSGLVSGWYQVGIRVGIRVGIEVGIRLVSLTSLGVKTGFFRLEADVKKIGEDKISHEIQSSEPTLNGEMDTSEV